jgi:N-acyl-D-aspartate/D-glutamate deacylase
MHPTYQTLEHLPIDARVAVLRKDEVKQQILSEQTLFTGRFNHDIAHGFWKMYPLGARPDYEPDPDDSIAARARRAGRDPYELCYALLLGEEGRSLILFPMSEYGHGNLDATWERLQHPDVLPSLADGGAHCGLICDASSTTYLLSYWARDRTRGPRRALEHVVARQTSEPANLYGMHDRGVVAPGYRADLNVIDFDELDIGAPYVAFDLPASGRRLLQDAKGYVATICAGEVTFDNGQSTGARAGRLVRGPQPGPGASVVPLDAKSGRRA